MYKVSEEGMTRLAKAAQNSELRIDEEARRLVQEGQSSDYYLGYANGIASVITICRCLVAKLGGKSDADPRKSAETIAGEFLVAGTVELIAKRTAAPAAVAAEHYLEARRQA